MMKAFSEQSPLSSLMTCPEATNETGGSKFILSGSGSIEILGDIGMG